MSPTVHFLDRTLRLIKEELVPSVDEATILSALIGTQVVIAADDPTAKSHSAQTAIVSTALLLARCGLEIFIDAPDVPLVGAQPPLSGKTLVSALTNFSNELDHKLRIRAGAPERCDVALVLGTPAPRRYHADLTLSMSCGRWVGTLGHAVAWPQISEPFGAMVAAAIASTETFKYAMQRLRTHARWQETFDDQFRICSSYSVRVAPESTALLPNIGAVDIISAGAVTNAAMFALLRIPGLTGSVRVIEPQVYEDTNHNRCMLMGSRSCGTEKAIDMLSYATPSLSVSAIVATFQDAVASGAVGQLTEHVIVGVDDIPTRWDVQRHAPHWVSVGATTHWSAMSSFHYSTGPCARCLHPRGDVDDQGAAPTISFVSFWAGLWCATYLMRALANDLEASEQVFLTPTGLFGKHGMWKCPVALHRLCPRHGSAA